MEQSAKTRLFMRMRVFQTNGPPELVERWIKGFDLPKEERELHDTSTESLKKRLHQAALALVINKKHNDPTSEQLYNECVEASHHLDRLTMKRVEELEHKVQILVLPMHGLPTAVGEVKKLSSSTTTPLLSTGTLDCEFHIRVSSAHLETTKVFFFSVFLFLL